METNSKHRTLMTCLGKAGIDNETRHDLVSGWTNGRTTSSKLMTEAEMDTVIRNMTRTSQGINKDVAALQLAKRDKRAVVLAIAGRVGFFPDGSSNFDYFNGWMRAKSTLKKDLWKYSFDELDKLLIQFRGIEAHFEASAKVPGTKAWHMKNKIPLSSTN